jgi:nanoRNase/pAp phosphatase (c-di-AMP/oligoRNAs hydrolase)
MATNFSSAHDPTVVPLAGVSEPSRCLNAQAKRQLRRSSRFLKALNGYDQLIVVMHDNPDPDAIATGWAIHRLVTERRGIPVRLVAGGDIVRAENRHMVELLRPPLELVEQLDCPPNTAVVLVDCGMDATHHLLCGDHVWPTAVLDHHEALLINNVAYSDVRPHLAASATIAATYLRSEGVEPGTELATALLYAMKTETSGGQTSYSSLDRQMLNWLTRRADPELLAEIEDAPLSRNYYSDLVLALQNTFLYDDIAFCMLPRAEGPEIVGEVADLLIRCREIQRVFCGAMVEEDVLISVRTAKENGNATELVRKTLEGIGHGGGHVQRAGGKVPGICLGDRVPYDVVEELKARWLAACGVERQRGTRLIRKQEIVRHL